MRNKRFANADPIVRRLSRAHYSDLELTGRLQMGVLSPLRMNRAAQGFRAGRLMAARHIEHCAFVDLAFGVGDSAQRRVGVATLQMWSQGFR